jgi:hypothetical protein
MIKLVADAWKVKVSVQPKLVVTFNLVVKLPPEGPCDLNQWQMPFGTLACHKVGVFLLPLLMMPSPQSQENEAIESNGTVDLLVTHNNTESQRLGCGDVNDRPNEG